MKSYPVVIKTFLSSVLTSSVPKKIITLSTQSYTTISLAKFLFVYKKSGEQVNNKEHDKDKRELFMPFICLFFSPFCVKLAIEYCIV